MYSQDEIKSVHGFLRATAEGNLKQMLVGGKMTEVHLRLLLKVARSVSETEFVTYFEAGTFPKMKFGAPEIAIREGFYDVCAQACAKVGLMSVKKAA